MKSRDHNSTCERFYSSSDLVISCSCDSLKKGFTLIELLIVMGIVAMLAGMSLTSITRSRTQNAVRQASQELAQAIREAESNALAVKGFDGGGEVTFPSYGVRFRHKSSATDILTEYWSTIVPNTQNESGRYEPNMTASYDKITHKVLPRGAVILKYFGDESYFTNDELEIVFTRPTPLVTFDSDNPAVQGASFVGICVGATDTNLTRVIKVWRSGHVSVGDFSTDCS